MNFDPGFSGRGVLAAVAVYLLMASSYAAPLDDLKSPLQEVRDKAAAELRQTFQPTPEARWTPVVEMIKPGLTKAEVVELLRPYKVTPRMGNASAQSYSEEYRLDGEWTLSCHFQDEGDVLLGCQLKHQLQQVSVAPPKKFTGTWTLYYVNGQKCNEFHYKNGRLDAELTAFHSDGSKSVVQHHTEKGANGPDTGYFPSGKVAYQGEYQDGKAVGTWTWYDEEGNVRKTIERGPPTERKK